MEQQNNRFLFATWWIVLLAFACLMPAEIWDSQGTEFILIIGSLGIWRYSWGALHFIRAQIYLHWVFPKMKRESDRITPYVDEIDPTIFLLVTSYRQPGETNFQIYKNLFLAALESTYRCHIIASVVEPSDKAEITKIYRDFADEEKLSLHFVISNGSGKRNALADAFRYISGFLPGQNSFVAVMDGDTMISADTLRKTIPHFYANPLAGALTTDEYCLVEGNEIYKRWYNLRFAQRHLLMSSMGLSKLVLTLTGRFSVFRGNLVCSQSFIQRIETDWLDHPRLGRFSFLTGDDKSSWYEMVRQGWQLIYIPDAAILTVETPPNDNFLIGSTRLMRRWSGNMLRTNMRALEFGPKKMGFFPWWTLIDQRISMWTTMTGVSASFIAMVIGNFHFALLYVFWIMLSRSFQALLLLSVRHKIDPAWPILLYYLQISGALVKIYTLFHLDRQKWTRQNTSQSNISGAFSTLAMALYLFAFGTLVALWSAAITIPGQNSFAFILLKEI